MDVSPEGRRLFASQPEWSYGEHKALRRQPKLCSIVVSLKRKTARKVTGRGIAFAQVRCPEIEF